MKKNLTYTHPSPIIFYDGECGFCQFWIRKIFSWDKRRQLYFAPLFGETYHSLNIASNIPNNSDTVIYYHDAKVFEKSYAVIQILSHFPAWKNWVIIFKMIPKNWADVIYDMIAKRRKSIPVHCALPPRDFLQRILP